MRLKDKIALVTGGSRGIGHAICLRLAEEGARVAVVDILEEEAEQTAAEIKAKGGQAMVVNTDVSQLDQVRTCVQQVTDTWGQVDILVNNAGWDRMEPFIDSQPETWEKVIAINLRPFGTKKTERFTKAQRKRQRAGLHSSIFEGEVEQQMLRCKT
jgi:2-hydroxycyclohexanecarboxyl-CoA dehydrogenase